MANDDDPTERERFDEAVEGRKERNQRWRLAIQFAGAIGIILALTLPISLLAGKRTVFDVSINVAISVTLGLGMLGTYRWGKAQKARADGLDARNERLEHEIARLRGTLERHKIDPEPSRFDRS